MSKIICKQAAYALSLEKNPDCNSDSENTIEWNIFNDTLEKPVYSESIRPNNPGQLREETVTIRKKYDPDSELIKYSGFYFLLQLKTDDRTFYVGSLKYPTSLSIASDGINTTLTFTAKSII